MEKTTTDSVLDAIDEVLAEERFSRHKSREDDEDDLPDRPPPGWCNY